MTDADRFYQWIKVLLVAFLALCTVIPNVGIWNAATVSEGVVDGFTVLWSIINFVVEGLAIWIFSKKVLFREDE